MLSMSDTTTFSFVSLQTEDVEGEELESSKVSIVNLVDLAGSERVGASFSQGDRLKVFTGFQF